MHRSFSLCISPQIEVIIGYWLVDLILFIMEELLKEYGFRQSTLPNEFTKGRKYKAIVWKANKVTISQYTPNYGRYLDSKTYESKSVLEKELKKNHA